MYRLDEKVRGCLLCKFGKKVEFCALNFLVKIAKMGRLTEVQRGQIATLHKHGESFVDIAREYGVSCKTVAYWVARDKAGSGFRDFPRRGRPRVTTPAMDRKIRKKLHGNRNASAKKLAAASEKKLGQRLSRKTIERRAHEQGLHNRMEVVVPKLLPGDKEIRLEYAQTKLDEDYDWSRVAWHDEKTVRLGQKRRGVWVADGEEPVVGQSAHTGKLNIWGCMGRRGFGPLVFFYGTMNQERMADYLKRYFCPSLEDMVGPRKRGLVSGHDNDGAYKAYTIRDLLKGKDIEILDHPARSPDLNPIENVWSIVQYAVDSHGPITPDDYQKWWGIEWRKLTPKIAAKLCNSMKARMEAMVKAHGGPIHK